MPFKVIIDFIDQHKDELGGRADQILPKLLDVYEENYSCYGVRKIWQAMNIQHSDQFAQLPCAPWSS